MHVVLPHRYKQFGWLTLFLFFLIGAFGQAQGRREPIARYTTFLPEAAVCNGLVLKPAGQVTFAGLNSTLADLNGDGKPDLISWGRAENSTKDITVRKNVGNGSFGQEIATTLTTTANYTLTQLFAVVDVNNDGMADLIFGSSTTSTNTTRPTISIFLQTDELTFRFAQTSFMQSATGPSDRRFGVKAVTTLDLNKDGILDMFIDTDYADGGSSGPWGKFLMIGNGNGTFRQVENLAGIGTEAYALADYDRDGVPDYRQIATARTTILFGTKGLAFNTRPATLKWEDAGAQTVFQVHYNDDAFLDFVCTGSKTVYLGSNTGAFTALTRTEAFPVIQSLQEQDLNGDGGLDWIMVGADNSLRIQRREADGTFRDVYQNSEAGDVAIEAGQNFDVDSQPDIFYRVTSGGQTQYSFLQSRADGSYLRSSAVLTGVQSLRYGDFDGDGSTDIAQIGSGSVAFLKVACANAPPAITPVAFTVQRGQSNVATVLATVSDPETAPGDLTITTGTIPTGVKFTNLNNANGTVTANVSVNCVAPLGSQTLELSVVDADGATTKANATFNVVAAPEIAPLVYADTTIPAGTATIVRPAAAFAGGMNLSLQVIPIIPGVTLDGTSGVVTVADTVTAGTYTLVVTALAPCQTVTSQFNLTVKAAPPPSCNVRQFQGSQSYATADTPSSLAWGDFNGDGKADIVTSNYEANVVSILLNDGAGGFQAAKILPTGNNPKAVSVGDLNNDGKLDLVVANLTSYDLSVLLGNGDGTFTTAPRVTGMSYPTSLAMGDFDEDGNEDLVIANSGSFMTTLLYGKGDGSFRFGFEHFNFDGGMPYAVTTGDYNHDGRLDFAVAFNTKDAIGVYLNLPDSFLNHVQMFPAGDQPIAIATADFDGDGNDDVAVANYGSNDVTLLTLRSVEGQLAGTIDTISVGNLPHSLAVADFNGDQVVDLIVGNDGTNFVTMLESSATGVQRVDVIGVESPSSIAVADFNGDNGPDLIIADYWVNRINVYRSACGTTASAKSEAQSFKTLRGVPRKYDGWPLLQSGRRLVERGR